MLATMRGITRYIEEARQRGTRIVEINPAGEALSPQERKIAPTLLIDPADDLAVMREEIFGPCCRSSPIARSTRPSIT